ncbi:eCIS core domain-containing protein [Flavobacterium sp. KACC 22763]|uniref:eCIS core domain-containing protein n=1 Tax=Flavobacterium sp. KACC 22763 TaxID=3025668 RepID=UPI0023670499|nr:DUF4157 domain-containing protein [Flavobacterium sp. KACC 22763]WDF65962.1 DUF4157 domain-containing protein [Flavobacterium sp. KACC 22763]
MVQHQEKISHDKVQISASNANNNAVQLQDNRQSNVVQKKLEKKAIAQKSTSNLVQKKDNNTGLPGNLKSGIENLSGHSMDDVKVHYNSDKPAQLNAHAYAQGSDIHIASGQEKHLPHEAWHVVQQKQGRVKPTLQMKGKASENTSSKTVQRMTVAPKPGALAMLGNDKKTIKTFTSLVEIMQHALQHFFPEDSIEIEITNTGELTPAWNHHKGTKFHPGTPGSIGVQLNKWYLEKVSIGNLIGMFIHEIGVHTFADKLMGKEILPNGRWQAKGDSKIAEEVNDEEKDHHNQIGGKIEKYPNAIENGKKKGRSRQRDHVNLAKSLSGGKSTRSQIYTKLYLDSGDSIEHKLDGEERDQALKDLTFSFLFDLGRLAATDDGGAVRLFKDTNAIGQLMVIYRDHIVKEFEDKHKWLKSASSNIKTGKWPLRRFLVAQLGSLTTSSNPIAQKTRSSVGGLIAGGLVLATGTTLATAAVPAIATGLAVGVGLHFLQKLFGI